MPLLCEAELGVGGMGCQCRLRFDCKVTRYCRYHSAIDASVTSSCYVVEPDSHLSEVERRLVLSA